MATGRQGPGRRRGALHSLRRKRRARMLKERAQQRPQGAWGGAMRETRLTVLRRRLALGRQMLEDWQERLADLEAAIAGEEGSTPAARTGRAGIRRAAVAAVDELDDDEEEYDDEQDEGYDEPYAARGKFTSLRDVQDRAIKRRRTRAGALDDDDEDDDLSVHDDEDDEGEDEDEDEEDEAPRRPLATRRDLRSRASSRGRDRADEEEEEDAEDPPEEVLVEVFEELRGNRTEFAEGYPRPTAVRKRLQARGAGALAEEKLRAAYDRYQPAKGNLNARERVLFRVFRSLEGRATAFTQSGMPKVDDVNIILDFLGEKDSGREEIDKAFEKYRAP